MTKDYETVKIIERFVFSFIQYVCYIAYIKSLKYYNISNPKQ